jgi:hypothetical protein
MTSAAGGVTSTLATLAVGGGGFVFPPLGEVVESLPQPVSAIERAAANAANRTRCIVVFSRGQNRTRELFADFVAGDYERTLTWDLEGAADGITLLLTGAYSAVQVCVAAPCPRPKQTHGEQVSSATSEEALAAPSIAA